MTDRKLSTYRVARQLCGMEIEEAAAFHGVSVATVRAWDENRAPASKAAWMDLASVMEQVLWVAQSHAEELMEDGVPPDFHRECPDVSYDHDPLPSLGPAQSAATLALLLAFAGKARADGMFGLGMNAAAKG